MSESNDDLRSILLEQVERLMADNVTPALLRQVEAGEFPQALWAEVEALGLATALVPEAQGGAGLNWDDAAALWQVLGRHNAAVPLGEAMLAARLAADAGLSPGEGLLTLSAEGGVPWGRFATQVLAGSALHDAKAIEWRHGRNMGGEPRDAAALPASGEDALLGGALLRAAQMAGGVETLLALGVDYANTRKQFGRLIGGFQAVQQLLAQCAGEVAAAGVAAASAGRAAARRGLRGAEFEIASAKVVCGEAAHRCAAIVHQVHAAIGFTEEHHLHLTTRRLWAWRDEFGAERLWAARIGKAALARGGAALWPDLTAREDARA